MDNKYGKIETFGSKCFVSRGVLTCVSDDTEHAGERKSELAAGVLNAGSAQEIKKTEKKKREKINLKFGNVSVQVVGAGRVTVKEDGNSLILELA